MKPKHVRIRVGDYDVWCKIKPGESVECVYDGDHPGNYGLTAEWLYGSGYGPTEKEAIKAFVLDCWEREKRTDL